MTASIITIGEELLIGQVIDTNSAWLAQQLNLLGIRIIKKTSIPDDAISIKSTLKHAMLESDIILLTGGLGPTKDDITKSTLAEFFNTQLETNTEVLEHIKTILSIYKVGMNKLNEKQAELPEKSEVLFNEVGTAPGMLFRDNGKMVVSMPGVPAEMKHIFTERLIPLLRNKSKTTIIHKTIHTIGIPESNMAVLLEDWETNLPKEISLAYLPSFGKLRLRMSARGTDSLQLQQLLNNEQQKLEELLGEAIFAYDDESLEESIGKLLLKNNLTLSTAESCTGGNIARTLTSVPGASAYYKGSIIAYANEVKTDKLFVPKDVLKTYGAVSKQTVETMAVGANKSMNTDISLSVSGIAGPDGGTIEKPVGTIWMAIAYRDKKVFSEVFRFRGNREFNINRTTVAALNLIRKFILAEF
jgi:nicotinamide-nucleotide amidase